MWEISPSHHPSQSPEVDWSEAAGNADYLRVYMDGVDMIVNESLGTAA